MSLLAVAAADPVDGGQRVLTISLFVVFVLATLVITTSQESYTPGRSAAEPWSGHLFLADVGARGLPPYRFG